jgi:hypothetical protein
MHGQVVENVNHAQAKQKTTHVSKKGKQMFSSFAEGEIDVKMKKLTKKKSLASSWERPFLLMKYLDNNGFRSKMKVARLVLLKVNDEKLWDMLKWDLQIFHVAP